MMTIGRLSRRTGVSVRTLRKYETLGLIYTAGRSPGNFRLFDEEALWCVSTVGVLRSLGLTLAEIQEIGTGYLHGEGTATGVRLSGVLQAVRERTEHEIAALEERLLGIAAFEAAFTEELGGRADFRAQDPTFHAKT